MGKGAQTRRTQVGGAAFRSGAAITAKGKERQEPKRLKVASLKLEREEMEHQRE